MKAYILSVFFILISSFTFAQNYYVDASALNVRESPSKNSEVVFKITDGDNVTLIDAPNSNGWAKIYFEGKEGYVSSNFIKKGRCIKEVYEYRTGAVCRDGSRSSATGRGACSHQGGVSYWLTAKKVSKRIVQE